MMMRIWATHNDSSAKRLSEAAVALGHEVIREDYRELVYGRWGRMAGNMGGVLLARQPYVANNPLEQYVWVLQALLAGEEFDFVLDAKLYEANFLVYEDKGYQSRVIGKLKLKRASVIPFDGLVKTRLPVIVKRRISSRGKGNFLLKGEGAVKQFLARDDRYLFLAQEYLPLKKDLRVLVLGDRVLGVMERQVTIKKRGRVTVRGTRAATVPDVVARQAVLLANHVGADFCGVDVGLTEDGEYVFIEYNPSPQFLGFERVTGVDVAKEVVDWCEIQANKGRSRA
jgi:hypothetical protein